jgi:predicted nucleotidyltransferase
VPQSDIDAIRAWADSKAIVSRVWVFGSRARGTNRTDSDLDVAVEHGALPGDSSPLTTSIGELDGWSRELQPKLSLSLDLESYIPGVTPTIEKALAESSVLIYPEDRDMDA